MPGHAHLRGRRASGSRGWSMRPGLTKGILCALGIEALAVALGVLVTWLLLCWA